MDTSLLSSDSLSSPTKPERYHKFPAYSKHHIEKAEGDGEEAREGSQVEIQYQGGYLA